MSRDTAKLADFYAEALGFRVIDRRAIPVPTSGFDTSKSRTLSLGAQTIELIDAGSTAPRLAECAPGWSQRFQHIAIVVSDMNAAYAHLESYSGWWPISVAGPEQLPASSGGVTAFKFRDPEGRPLELLCFPCGRAQPMWTRSEVNSLFVGIDHSAISVVDTERSLNFYRTLGFERGGGSHNLGPEQGRLDDVTGADVIVTGLELPSASAPHLELLCYRGEFDRPTAPLSPHDLSATQIVLSLADVHDVDRLYTQHPTEFILKPMTLESGVRCATLRDPDGHILCLEAPSSRLPTR